MTGAELFDRFVGGQATAAEIARLDAHITAEQIHEMRESEPDDIDMGDHEIAEAILQYAIADQEEQVEIGAELVKIEDNCPRCGERRMDWLAWVGFQDFVRCGTCGMVYTPESTED